MNDRSTGLPPNAILAMMAATALFAGVALLPIKGPPDGDFPLFLIPWLDVIRERGIASISGEFSMYTPPYIYLLNIASLMEPVVGPVAAVKSVNVPFVAALVVGLGTLVRHATGDRNLGKIAVAIGIVSPTLLLNAFGYGQCDVIYTSFLVWFVYFAVRDRPALACVMFGLAVSFKLQAVFESPLLVTLFLWRRMKFWHPLLIPLTYILAMAPAAVAGRPWADLLTIYLRQGQFTHSLSMNAQNPWWLLRGLVDYQTGVTVGLAAGMSAGALIAWRSVRLPQDAVSMLLVATVSSAVLPYVLPKMHERYFFVADMLTLALAFSRPRLWPAAVLIPIGSLLASMSYFMQRDTAALALVPTTLGVGLLIFALFSRPSEQQEQHVHAI